MMECPKCGLDMEFEEAKNFYGYWYCDCGFESSGSNIPCGVEGGMLDYESKLNKEE